MVPLIFTFGSVSLSRKTSISTFKFYYPLNLLNSVPMDATLGKISGKRSIKKRSRWNGKHNYFLS